MEHFAVPQFIDVEDKIFGPITTRQFVICLVGATLEFVCFKLLTFGVFAFVGVLIFALTGTLAFLRVNGQPFHFFLLNLVQTLKRPRVKVWDKSLTAAELRAFTRIAPAPAPLSEPRKVPITASKLQELALIVNTGGVYRPEADSR